MYKSEIYKSDIYKSDIDTVLIVKVQNLKMFRKIIRSNQSYQFGDLACTNILL